MDKKKCPRPDIQTKKHDECDVWTCDGCGREYCQEECICEECFGEDA